MQNDDCKQENKHFGGMFVCPYVCNEASDERNMGLVAVVTFRRGLYPGQRFLSEMVMK